MKVTFLQYNKTVEVEKGSSILNAAVDADIVINDNLCNSHKCGKCKVIVSKGNNSEITKDEEKILSAEEIKRGIRLACCFRAKEDCVVLTFNYKKEIIEKNESNNTIIDKKFYIACDLGTTTIEIALVSKEKDIVDKISDRNPQRIVGQDVISRIAYCVENKSGQDILNKLVINKINDLIVKLCKENQISQNNIEKIVVVGNSTMINIFANKDVSLLGRKPFDSKFKAGIIEDARKMGINISGEILLPRLIKGHVGSDTYECELVVNKYEKKNHLKDRVYLIIDIGTNGEIVLFNKGKRSVCSTAAGPAFEGASLSCGMKNDYGAVKAVKYENGNIKYDVEGIGIVGEEKTDYVKGISGSGIIDLTAIMLDVGIIDETGLITSKNLLGLQKIGKIEYTQDDIRNIQMAKAAIMTAIISLLKEHSLSIDDVEMIYVAGAFGSKINIGNAIKIGLLPNVSKEKYIQIGNAALLGAVDNAFDGMINENLNELHLELSDLDYFSEIYINQMNLATTPANNLNL